MLSAVPRNSPRLRQAPDPARWAWKTDECTPAASAHPSPYHAAACAQRCLDSQGTPARHARRHWKAKIQTLIMHGAQCSPLWALPRRTGAQ